MARGIYICTRVSEEPLPQVASEKRHCQFCAADVWVDPDKYAATAERGDLTLICATCYAENKHVEVAAAAEVDDDEVDEEGADDEE